MRAFLPVPFIVISLSACATLPPERQIVSVPDFGTYSFTHEGGGMWEPKGTDGDYLVFFCRGDGGRFELKGQHGEVIFDRDNLRNGTEIWLKEILPSNGGPVPANTTGLRNRSTLP